MPACPEVSTDRTAKCVLGPVHFRQGLWRIEALLIFARTISAETRQRQRRHHSAFCKYLFAWTSALQILSSASESTQIDSSVQPSSCWKAIWCLSCTKMLVPHVFEVINIAVQCVLKIVTTDAVAFVHTCKCVFSTATNEVQTRRKSIMSHGCFARNSALAAPLHNIFLGWSFSFPKVLRLCTLFTQKLIMSSSNVDECYPDIPTELLLLVIDFVRIDHILPLRAVSRMARAHIDTHVLYSYLRRTQLRCFMFSPSC